MEFDSMRAWCQHTAALAVVQSHVFWSNVSHASGRRHHQHSTIERAPRYIHISTCYLIIIHKPYWPWVHTYSRNWYPRPSDFFWCVPSFLRPWSVWFPLRYAHFLTRSSIRLSNIRRIPETNSCLWPSLLVCFLCANVYDGYNTEIVYPSTWVFVFSALDPSGFWSIFLTHTHCSDMWNLRWRCYSHDVHPLHCQDSAKKQIVGRRCRFELLNFRRSHTDYYSNQAFTVVSASALVTQLAGVCLDPG